MARIQALTQEHALERSFAPTGSRMVSGMSGASEGVPTMHPLKSSGPVFKAGNLIHLLRIKKFSMPHPKLSMHSSMRLPKFHV